MSIQDEHDIKQKLKHPSAYLEIDEDGEEAKLDGTFTLAEVEQIAKVMRGRVVSFPDTVYCTTEEFLGKAVKELTEKLAEDITDNMTELYILPDGNGIELTRIVAVHYCNSYQSEYHERKAKVKLEYRGHTTNFNPLSNSAVDNIAVSYVEFNSDMAAISFRDELIRLRNSNSKDK